MSGLDEYRRKQRDAKKAREEAEGSAKVTEGQLVSSSNNARTANLRPWQPGQSGNPNGRPALPPIVRAKFQEKALDLAEKLLELCASNDERIRLAAIESVYNRIYGKPVQQVDAEVKTTSVQQAHLEVLLNLQAKREEAMKVIEGHTQRVEEYDPSKPKE